MGSQDVGRAGEEFARSYVERLGYEILGCNMRFGRKEVDILAVDGDTLVVIEVKTRLTWDYGMPEEQISAAKLRSLKQIASVVSAACGGATVRVDVISIRAFGFGACGLRDANLSHIKNVIS
ncbi:MAG TPA: YraN family protein [Bacillota bacterium]|jgi:putative endonuclease|nr:YraN family protein [Bacillota bacterium]